MIGNLLSRYLEGKEARELAAEHAAALRTVEEQRVELEDLRRRLDDYAKADRNTSYLVADNANLRKLQKDATNQAKVLEEELGAARRRIASLLEAADLRRIPRIGDGWKAQAEQDRANCVVMQDRLRAAELALEMCGREHP